VAGNVDVLIVSEIEKRLKIKLFLLTNKDDTTNKQKEEF
jgi:hypothetical protein